MEWYNYVAAFFAGAFLANTVPHFVHGISGNRFPTPFATPRGVGLSSSTLNVSWSLFNLAVGWLLAVSVHITQFLSLQITCFVGVSLMALMLSKRFQAKHKE
ncbi:hypothetical protein DIU31_024320 [Mucilaginibacter rubeus]|uniref:Uncharacterized protein n=1 Tax=Mucilaginibacter rubeus TaxID=2027860 RepID=A0AAE6JIN2_9SPHI|nr:MULTISPECIES: hypothetical protein [Mucilaginibacter]QEM06489.1 hypothetical protein DIU31_024320 [Mucilaginibacter rubeus]QEM19075.1 hypothetical protein DIU38_024570 [Mucilaginibacter gossypii]QTE44383.1 hypothetical protein J3L19_03145 [Mucilaginibacter rubeus]QTE50982.1 hypothetical protein J3L21_03120 [Mucilaginibacter rubeus]QTE56066.1 hypothetical protein J3L23_28360 [Mucilaginibacter rubeus]